MVVDCPCHGIPCALAWGTAPTPRHTAPREEPEGDPVIRPGRARIDTENDNLKKYAIGIAVSHVYGIEVMAEDHDQAFLKMDSWLRGNLPADALAAKIRSSDLKVVGLGLVSDGRISRVPEISMATRVEMGERGNLPQSIWLQLLPVPDTLGNHEAAPAASEGDSPAAG